MEYSYEDFKTVTSWACSKHFNYCNGRDRNGIGYISGYPVLYGVLSTGIQYEHPLSVQELKNEKVIIV